MDGAASPGIELSTPKWQQAIAPQPQSKSAKYKKRDEKKHGFCLSLVSIPTPLTLAHSPALVNHDAAVLALYTHTHIWSLEPVPLPASMDVLEILEPLLLNYYNSHVPGAMVRWRTGAGLAASGN